MMAVRRLLATAALLALAGCGTHPVDEDDGWRPLRANSPIFSPGGTFGRQRLTTTYGSSLTVPRVTGTTLVAPPMQEEEGNVWPAAEAPRTTLTDPDAVARGIPNFRPQDLPPQSLPPQSVLPQDPSSPARGLRPIAPAGRTGDVVRRPDGTTAVRGAGMDGVWTYEVPGRPGVGTAVPDGSGGRVLLEPGGGTVIAPR